MTTLIIDGPGLVYAVNYRLLAWKSQSSSVLDAQPSYKEIGNATVHFLEQLSRCGITIEKVYFDGYLPPQKRVVRISRLESYLKQLVTYHANNRDLKSENYGSTEPPLSVDSLFGFSRPVPAKFRGLPAAPFLVPAALERLASSQFADVVEIVPGEADSFCAGAARKSGGLVVTGDSDLLVYDLGLNEGVIFLDQLELRACDVTPGNYSLAANVAIPHQIGRRLGIESVQRLAFELKDDPSITLQEAVRRSQNDIGLAGKRIYYQIFCEEYAKETSTPNDKEMDNQISSSQMLDPRLSELALQCDDAQQNTVHMYLPFLMEDPSRASAWGVSSGLRSLAYTLLVGLDSQRTTPIILEYSRRDIRIVATGVRILDSSDLALAAKILNRKLVAIRDRFVTLSPASTWRIFGMVEVFSWYMDSGRTLPSHLAFSKVFRGSKGDLISWQDVQLSAMLQAALYSTRLLKQVLNHVKYRATTRLESKLSMLQSHLEKLPPLQELIPSQHELEDIASMGFEPDITYAFVKEWVQTEQDDDESPRILSIPGHRPGASSGKVKNEQA